jgi:ComEC/Rec2-related protein
VLLRRPLFWATVLAGAFAFYEQGHESLGIVNDPAALHTKKDVNISGILVSPVRRARMGWWTLIDFSSGTISSRAQLWLPTAVDPVPYEPGRTVEVTGQLRRARRPRNPGDYNEQSRLEALGAVWVLRASHAQVSAGSPPPQWLAHDLAQRVKLGIEASFYRQLSIPRAALLSGILLGDIGGLGREDSVAIRNSGGTHLLVVSGLKVSFIAAIAVSLGLALGLAPGLRSLLAISVGGFYTLMAACDPPSLRAWMMLTAGAGARTLDRAISPSASLTLAAFILLMADPAAALSPGSLMSFGGTAALLAVVRRLEATAPTYWPRVLRHVWVLVGINLAITIALWPLFAAVFGRGSLIGPLANVALVPIACSLMGSGLILWVFDRCIPVAAYPIVQITDYGLSLFEMVCRWAAHYPWSSIELRQWH